MEKSIDLLVLYLRQAKKTGEIRRRLNVEPATEWAARITMSLASTPSVTVDLSGEKEVRAFVRDHLMRGFR